MNGMTWVRVEVGILRNPKTLELLGERGGDHAFCVYVFSLGYAAEQGTSGFIPKLALESIRGTDRSVNLLVQVGMWRECPGGWDVNDYAEYQPTDEAARARSARAKKAADARWKKQREKDD